METKRSTRHLLQLQIEVVIEGFVGSHDGTVVVHHGPACKRSPQKMHEEDIAATAERSMMAYKSAKTKMIMNVDDDANSTTLRTPGGMAATSLLRTSGTPAALLRSAGEANGGRGSFCHGVKDYRKGEH